MSMNALFEIVSNSSVQCVEAGTVRASSQFSEACLNGARW